MPHMGSLASSRAHRAGTVGTDMAVLTIEDLPRRLRLAVESTLCLCLPEPSKLVPLPGTPLWDCRWFTRWHHHEGRLSCCEVINGTGEQLEDLAEVLGAMAREHGFTVQVDLNNED
ncbi:hypothetical protein GP475_08210 [Corynebacterium poyangense]|uniref:Uncharacterized protein n=1 Tax=Corynebacterium poyangense TaxID=2684405 RepID=A0A7H0SPZ9_9CORY|nr:hypothetical protein [Corynebacterium poyangense]QNQ90624.1 hypothetical protein GP475_08210 [Corynebacterium poyangense]